MAEGGEIFVVASEIAISKCHAARIRQDALWQLARSQSAIPPQGHLKSVAQMPSLSRKECPFHKERTQN
jgi:hypothetical protein